MKKATAFIIASVVIAWFLAFALLAGTTTMPSSQPTSQPASQPAKLAPQVVLILGYGTTDGLMKAVDSYWRPRLGSNARLLITIYDHDVAAEIQSAFPTGELRLVGFSHGGWKAIEVAKGFASPTRGPPRNIQRLVLLDSVPFPNPKPNFAGFDLPDNVLSAWCCWRGYADQKTLFSGPIKSAKCEYEVLKYNPKPNPDEAARHGQYVWDNRTVQEALK